MRKNLWLLAALMIVFALVAAGCTAAPAPQPAAPQPAAPAAEEAAPAEVSELSGELTFWSGYPEMAPLYDKVIADFQALHPNVTVTYLTHPLREYEQKLATTLPTQTGPDVFEGSLYANLKFVELGLLDPTPQWVLDRLEGAHDASVIEYNTVDGARYGIPFFEGRPAIYYNTDCFEEAGLDLPSASEPTDWDTLMDYAQKTTQRNEAGEVTRSGLSLRLSGAGSGVTEKWLIMGLPHGLRALEQTADGKWHAAYTGEAGHKTLSTYLTMLYDWNTDSHDIKHDAEAFELGQTCMFQRETWVIGDIALKAPDLNYGTMPLPRGTDWRYLRNSFSIFVTQTTPNPELAWEFALFLIEPENQRFMLQNIGWLPSRSDVDYSDIVAEQPGFEAFLVSDPAYEAYYLPKLGVFDEIWTKMAERLTNAYLDSSLVNNPEGIQKVLDDMAEETNSILQREGLYGE